MPVQVLLGNEAKVLEVVILPLTVRKPLKTPNEETNPETLSISTVIHIPTQQEKLPPSHTSSVPSIPSATLNDQVNSKTESIQTHESDPSPAPTSYIVNDDSDMNLTTRVQANCN